MESAAVPNTTVLAVLACQYKEHYVGILLYPVDNGTNLPLYAVGSRHEPAAQGNIHPRARVIHLDPEADPKTVRWPQEACLAVSSVDELITEWKEIHISNEYGGCPSVRPMYSHLTGIPSRYNIRVLPVIPRWVIGALALQNFGLSWLLERPTSTTSTSTETTHPSKDFGDVDTREKAQDAEPNKVSEALSPSEGIMDLVVNLSWRYTHSNTASASPATASASSPEHPGFTIRIRGTYARSSDEPDGSDSDSATSMDESQARPLKNLRAGVAFDCQEPPSGAISLYLISQWTGGSRTFREGEREVRLTFSPARRGAHVDIASEDEAKDTAAPQGVLESASSALEETFESTLVIEVGGRPYRRPPLPKLEWEDTGGDFVDVDELESSWEGKRRARHGDSIAT